MKPEPGGRRVPAGRPRIRYLLLAVLILLAGAGYQYFYQNYRHETLMSRQGMSSAVSGPSWSERAGQNSLLSLLLDADRRIFLAVHELSGGPLDYLLAWPTFLGSFYILWPLLVLLWLMLFGRRDSGRFILLMVSLLTLQLVEYSLKFLTSRPRPFVTLDHGDGSAARMVEVLFEPPVYYSFPSGHAAAVFAVAFFIYRFMDGRPFWVFLLAGWIAFSRVYIGVHYPLDIVAGSLLGSGWAWLSIKTAGRAGLVK